LRSGRRRKRRIRSFLSIALVPYSAVALDGPEFTASLIPVPVASEALREPANLTGYPFFFHHTPRRKPAFLSPTRRPREAFLSYRFRYSGGGFSHLEFPELRSLVTSSLLPSVFDCRYAERNVPSVMLDPRKLASSRHQGREQNFSFDSYWRQDGGFFPIARWVWVLSWAPYATSPAVEVAIMCRILVPALTCPSCRLPL